MFAVEVRCVFSGFFYSIREETWRRRSGKRSRLTPFSDTAVKNIVQEASFKRFFFRQKFGFPREKGVSLSNFVTYLRALMLKFILNSLLLIYSFVFSLRFFPYVIFIFYFQEYRKIRKTQGDQKDLTRERMKTKLRIKLIWNIFDKKWQSWNN